LIRIKADSINPTFHRIWRMANQTDMQTFFEPKGVVIVGARRSPGFGYGLPKQMIDRGWGDRLHLVSPSGGEMHGKKVYERVADVPDPVDLAVVIVPAVHVPGILEDIARRGIRHVIIESAGFIETDEKGAALQAEIKRIQVERGLRVIGPNCVGVLNTDNAFSTAHNLPEAFHKGRIAVVAQSGVFGNILLDRLTVLGLHVSKVVTLGNRLDVDECEVLEYLRQDDATRLVLLYLEGAADGRALRQTLEKLSALKPVIVLKSGRTLQGKAATASHTGSLSGEDALYEGVFRQTGAIRVESLHEMIEFTRTFATQPLPAGNRLGILTASGSLGALSTDAAIDQGLEIPLPSAQTIATMEALAPEWMNVKNPLDIGPSLLFQQSLPVIVQDAHMDMVLAIVTIPYSAYRQIAEAGFTALQFFGDIRVVRDANPEKPFLISVVAHQAIEQDVAELAGPGTPVFTSPEMAVKSLAALWRYGAWKRR
jgi:acyl-CoA synthetase (NDP forming)